MTRSRHPDPFAIARFVSVWIFVLGSLLPPLAAAPTNHLATGTLHLARLFDPATLDPTRQMLQEDVLLTPLLFRTLLDVRDGTNLFASAARDWSASPDRTVYRFFLRPGRTFSNGRPV